ncbi:MAG TPA: S41 family peptidase [Candidatus Gracilibacteria bacterium]
MKRYTALVVSGLILIMSFVLAPVQAFTDVHPHQNIYDAVQYFLEKGSLDDRGQFSADRQISQGLFWKLVMSEVGVDKDGEVEDLPAGILPDDPLAPYLSQAVKMRLIEARITFNQNDAITQGAAIKAILASKDILPPKRVTPAFRNKVTGISPRSSYLRYLEAAFASNIIEEKDFQPFTPHAKLTRRQTVEWLYNFKEGGEKKESTTEPERFTDENPNVQNGRMTGRNIKAISQLTTRTKTNDTLSIPDGKILEEVYRELINSYRFGEDITQEKRKAMVNAAIAAMVEEMGDKYSSYIQPKDVSKFQGSLDGNFEGIGAYVDMIEGKFTIISPIKGSPAEEAGLLPGDVVDKVDGEPIEGKDIHTITSLIKGQAGTKVKLAITRNLGVEEIEVTRGEITVPSINLEWQKGIPVIGIHQFNRDTGIKLRQLIEAEVIPKNPKGLVIDFRNDPGGYLVAAVQVGEIFLKEGREIFSVEYKDNTQTYKASRTGPLESMTNIVVLQNKGTASASEIVASMLQDYGKATIMGSPSLGKGTVQNINNFNNGGLLKLTVAKWLSPKGRWIHEKGVIPDVEMEDQTVEERRAKIDKPLERAVQHVLGNS